MQPAQTCITIAPGTSDSLQLAHKSLEQQKTYAVADLPAAHLDILMRNSQFWDLLGSQDHTDRGERLWSLHLHIGHSPDRCMTFIAHALHAVECWQGWKMVSGARSMQIAHRSYPSSSIPSPMKLGRRRLCDPSLCCGLFPAEADPAMPAVLLPGVLFLL